MYSYLDIVFLVLVVIFLVVFFIRTLGKNVGLQKEDLAKNNPNINYTQIYTQKETVKKQNTEANFSKNKEEDTNKYAEGSLNYKLALIANKDPNFNLKNFIASSKKAFALIATNFNKGNLNEIQPYVTSEVYDSFKAQQGDVKSENSLEIQDFLIADVIDAEVKQNIGKIKVKFLTKQKINSQLTEVNEVWSFKKDLTENTPIWKLFGVSYN